MKMKMLVLFLSAVVSFGTLSLYNGISTREDMAAFSVSNSISPAPNQINSKTAPQRTESRLAATPGPTRRITGVTPLPGKKTEAKVPMLKSDLHRLIEKEAGLYSIAVVNLKTGERFNMNLRKMPSASNIKIFIMIEAYKQINQGMLREDDAMVIRNSMKVGGTGGLQSVKEGTTRTIKQLIELMITQSDNTATNILINRLGMKSINEKIRSLGCKNTVLQRKMMDFDSIRQGKDNFTSVEDLALVLEKLYRGQCVNQDTDKKMIAILKRQQNNNKIPRLLPKGTVTAHKTGELTGISNDAGIIYRKKGDYILCTMTQNLPDVSKGDTVIAKISKKVYEGIDS